MEREVLVVRFGSAVRRPVVPTARFAVDTTGDDCGSGSGIAATTPGRGSGGSAVAAGLGRGMFGVTASLVGVTMADDRSKPPSRVMMAALEAATANMMSAALTASVGGLRTRKCGLADGVTSLATCTASRTGETTTAGAAVAGGCASETNPDSESMPSTLLPISLPSVGGAELSVGGPERMSQESGCRAGAMFTLLRRRPSVSR